MPTPRRSAPITVCTYLAPGFPESLFDALTTHIGRRLGRPARLRVDSSCSGPRRDDDEPFTTGEVDVAFMCSTAYAWLCERTPVPVTLVGAAWVPLDARAAARPVYFTDLVARADDERRTLADYGGGARIACNDRSSLSGYLSLRLEAHRLGELARSAQLVFTGGHEQSIVAVVSGDVDLAALDSIVRWTRARDQPDVAALRTLVSLGPFPTQAVVARADMDGDERATIGDALLGAHRDSAGSCAEELRAAGLARFDPVDDRTYADLRHALARVEGRARDPQQSAASRDGAPGRTSRPG